MIKDTRGQTLGKRKFLLSHPVKLLFLFIRQQRQLQDPDNWTQPFRLVRRFPRKIFNDEEDDDPPLVDEETGALTDESNWKGRSSFKDCGLVTKQEVLLIENI